MTRNISQLGHQVILMECNGAQANVLATSLTVNSSVRSSSQNTAEMTCKSPSSQQIQSGGHVATSEPCTTTSGTNVVACVLAHSAKSQTPNRKNFCEVLAFRKKADFVNTSTQKTELYLVNSVQNADGYRS